MAPTDCLQTLWPALEGPIIRNNTGPLYLSQMSQISWDTLRRNNEKKSNKKFAVNSGKIIMRGPAGPRGPPGAVMTKEDIAREFKKMIKEAADKKARKIISVKCPSCDLTNLDTDVLSFFYPV
ncbi:hypothetical protein EB796_012095 [Bugula neritina]|uniref:Uncharacterized protein n=1 Tax=Bugula neritina TaxID=10212 RepID=A0A7J7JT99_BUGNE|nr:hypothetical protein EB796_012095 [Bugula neritina]